VSTPATEAGRRLLVSLQLAQMSRPPAPLSVMVERITEAILAIEAEAAALAHDRPSGSVGLLSRDNPKSRWHAEQITPEYRSSWACVPLADAVVALSGSSDPEAVGLDELTRAIGIIAIEDRDRTIAGDYKSDTYAEHAARLIAAARLAEARPETPA